MLRGHCADVGRDYDEIEKTVMTPLDLGPDGENVDDDARAAAAELAELGVQHVHTMLPLTGGLGQIELFAEKVIPAAAAL